MTKNQIKTKSGFPFVHAYSTVFLLAKLFAVGSKCIRMREIKSRKYNKILFYLNFKRCTNMQKEREKSRKFKRREIRKCILRSSQKLQKQTNKMLFNFRKCIYFLDKNQKNKQTKCYSILCLTLFNKTLKWKHTKFVLSFATRKLRYSNSHSVCCKRTTTKSNLLLQSYSPLQ